MFSLKGRVLEDQREAVSHHSSWQLSIPFPESPCCQTVRRKVSACKEGTFCTRAEKTAVHWQG